MQPAPNSDHVERTRSRELHFTGSESAPSALPWGQRFMRESIKRIEPFDQHLNLHWIQSVPKGASLETVLGALESIVGRHESLRTRYDVEASGQPVQTVAGRGSFTVHIRETGSADLNEAADEARRDFRSRRYDLSRDPLIRAAVITKGDQPRLLVIGLSHMVADGWACQRFQEELTELMDPAAGGPAATRQAAWQPSDQIRLELTDAARRRSDRSSAYLAARFQTFPSTMFWQRRDAVEHPRYWSGRLDSPAITHAVAAIYASCGVTPSQSILAAFALAIGKATMNDTCCMFFIHSNRNRGNADSIANYSQTVPVEIDLKGDSFWNLMKTTRAVMFKAYQYASHPLQNRISAMRAAGDGRGISLAEDCVYNPQWWTDGQQPARLAADAAQINDPLEQPGTFSWNEGADRGLLMYLGTSPNRLTMTADTKFFAPDRFEPFLRSVENMLVRGAKEDFDPGDIRVGHAERPGDEWTFIDRCWVSLEATRGMVTEATGAEAVEIALAPGTDGRGLLTACISGSGPEMDYEDVRSRCLEVLPRWRNAMVPHRFTASWR